MRPAFRFPSALPLATLIFAVTVVGVAVPARAAGDDDNPSLRLRVESATGDDFSLDLSSGWLSGLVRTALAAGFDCNSTLDRDSEKMLRHLAREGDGARYTYTAEDGQVVRARRHRDQLELRVRKEDGEASRISIPWALASCALGEKVKLGELFDEEGGLHISIDGSDGDRVRINID